MYQLPQNKTAVVFLTLKSGTKKGSINQHWHFGGKYIIYTAFNNIVVLKIVKKFCLLLVRDRVKTKILD